MFAGIVPFSFQTLHYHSWQSGAAMENEVVQGDECARRPRSLRDTQIITPLACLLPHISILLGNQQKAWQWKLLDLLGVHMIRDVTSCASVTCPDCCLMHSHHTVTERSQTENNSLVLEDPMRSLLFVLLDENISVLCLFLRFKCILHRFDLFSWIVHKNPTCSTTKGSVYFFKHF